MPFNKEQLCAIHAKPDRDILIAAGAGSGKTKVLSEHVFSIIEDKKSGIEPSSLLVLTFTKNAAHEMKTRILVRFGKDNPNMAKMLSAHVQTFDSLNQYIVATYSERLGLSDAISVADDNVLNAKIHVFLDKVLQDYYEDDAKRARIVAFLSKYSLKDDRALKKAVLDLYKEIHKFTKKKRKDFYAGYDARCLSEGPMRESYHQIAETYRHKVIELLYEADIFLAHPEFMPDAKDIPDPKQAASFFSSQGHFGKSYESIRCSENPKLDAVLTTLCGILKQNDEEFLDSLIHLKAKYPAAFPSRCLISKEEKDESGATLSSFLVRRYLQAKLTSKEEGWINPILGMGSFEEEKAKVLHTKEDVHLLLDLVADIDVRLDEYKRETNSFSFSDISELSLLLLTDPQYADCAEELRERFRYIMVDEYQDTNDAQEDFLDSLTQPRISDGGRAHIFCVGDAKQAIYSFRNSNVALFRARQEQYDAGAGEVIPMNKNYRSGEGLLSDINYLFTHYMTLQHGAIDYQKEGERLAYDHENGRFGALHQGKPFPHFGVYRIVHPNEALRRKLDHTKKSEYKENLWECMAILDDIKKKVADGFLIYDPDCPGDHTRPARYGDFAILFRVKSLFATYQKVFTENGVKINNILTTNLREENSFTLIGSLLKMLLYLSGGPKIDVKHIFASIVRSYAYRYSDSRIHELLSCQDPHPLAKIEEDGLYEEMEKFAKNHKDSSFLNIFMDMLSTFHVVDALPRLGDVDGNLSKIDSLYAMVCAQSNLGEGMASFAELLLHFDTYDLNLDASSQIESEDAVDMMTIHASKGLERKIVYLPCNGNGLTQGNGREKPLFSFSYERGVVLPDCTFAPALMDMPGEGEEEFLYDPTTLFERARSVLPSLSRADVDEHVRLLYVALTRATNSVIVVGTSKKAESPEAMFDACPSFMKMDRDYLEKKKREKILSGNVYSAYLALLDVTEHASLPLTPKNMWCPEAWNVYLKYGTKYVIDGRFTALDHYSEMMRHEIYEKDYWQQFCAMGESMDALARLYALHFHPSLYAQECIKTLDGLYAALQKVRNGAEEPIDEEEDDEGEDSSSESEEEGMAGTAFDPMKDAFRTREEWEDFLTTWYAGLRAEDPTFADPADRPSQEIMKSADKRRAFIEGKFFGDFAELFDGAKDAVETCFTSDGFTDERQYFDAAANCINLTVTEPEIVQPHCDDAAIDFPLREKRQVSKKAAYHEEGEPAPEFIERGTHLHLLMELVDFAHPDLSYIEDEEDRATIQRALDTPLLQEAQHADHIYTEYGFYDPNRLANGFIDLLYERNGVYTIVDYKSSSIKDPAYADQLRAYKENVMRLFGVGEDKVRMYLLSLSSGDFRPIAATTPGTDSR